MIPRIANRSHDRRVDQVLRRLGSDIPPTGMEERIKARLAYERAHRSMSHAPRSVFLGIPRVAFGLGAGAVACFGIVAGSIYHSHSIQPVLPGLGSPAASQGVGPASVARPADRPISPAAASRPRSVRHLPEGRAVISPQSQKPAGVAIPKTPAAQH